MWKIKSFLIGIGTMLILVGCAPNFSTREEVIEDSISEETPQETAIIPSSRVSEQEYQVLLPYRLSESRGVILNQVANRLDITEIENGLRRHSTDVFDPETHFFQEGQRIGSSELYSWLERYSESTDRGLNPEVTDRNELETDEIIDEERDNPRYLSHILEQNYLVRTDENVVQLGGMSLAIIMKSNYRFQTEIGGPYYYKDIDEDEMLEQVDSITSEVIQRIRAKDGLQEVPIMVAIYREAARDGLVPGNYVMKTTVQGGSSSVGSWEPIDEEYVLFPSSSGRDKDPDLAATIEEFTSDIADFFPNYVGVIGEGFYEGDQLRKLTLEIPIQFRGKAETIGFTQYVYGLIMDGFQPHYDLEINIKSNDRQESLIVREAGAEEPIIHIYDR
ncbi:protein involved in sex pheromone biosynthesis [Natronobacillus azotifigens]|uniref:CamS family sex pheromone protein n=1 Tax=Natronobacillus azotifigens TaxID=472978 RepID=UPI002342CC3F|nr:CamS family sex pheromone protein [Natronobacillus azotifigens]